jgi:hypothetical protein
MSYVSDEPLQPGSLRSSPRLGGTRPLGIIPYDFTSSYLKVHDQRHRRLSSSFPPFVRCSLAGQQLGLI